jgi:hypothetical protein
MDKLQSQMTRLAAAHRRRAASPRGEALPTVEHDDLDYSSLVTQSFRLQNSDRAAFQATRTVAVTPRVVPNQERQVLGPIMPQYIEPGAVDYSSLYERGPLNTQSNSNAWWTTYHVDVTPGVQSLIHVVRGQGEQVTGTLKMLTAGDPVGTNLWLKTCSVPVTTTDGVLVGTDRWVITGICRAEAEQTEGETAAGAEDDVAGLDADED